MLYVSLIVATFLFFTIFFISFLKQRITRALLVSNPEGNNHRITPIGDISNYYSLTMAFGLSLSLLITILIFEWPSFSEKRIIHEKEIAKGFPIPIDIPITEHKVPERPKVNLATISPDSEIEIDYFEPESLPIEDLPKTDVIEVAIDYGNIDEPEEEIVDNKIYDFIPGANVLPKGDWVTFYSDLRKKIKMPEEAIRAGIKGKVFIEFVVEKDGSLSNFKVQKGLGYGLEEEVIRALKEMPRFTPAYQGHRAVRFRMTLPVRFM